VWRAILDEILARIAAASDRYQNAKTLFLSSSWCRSKKKGKIVVQATGAVYQRDRKKLRNSQVNSFGIIPPLIQIIDQPKELPLNRTENTISQRNGIGRFYRWI